MKWNLALALAVLISAPVEAEILEVPLEPPEYIGYTSPPSVLDLDVEFNPYIVVDVRVRLTGASCGVYYHCGDAPYNWNFYRQYATVRVALGVDAEETALTEATRNFSACDGEPVPFDVEVSLPPPAGGWAALADQDLQLILSSLDHWFTNPVDHTRCYLVDDFHGLETLVLIIETDSTVPNENTTWSAIKAVYR